MLKPLKRDRKNCFSTLDIETAPDGSVLDIAIFNGEKVTYFTGWREFFIYLQAVVSDDKRYRKFLAHSGGGFDYVSMIEFLLNNKKDFRFTFEVILSGSDIVLIELFIGDKKVQFIDTYKTLPASLANLSELFNVTTKKQKIEKSNYKDMRKFKTDDPDLYYKYLGDDVISLFEIAIAFEKILDIEFFPVTAASLALYLFRRKFQTINLFKVKPEIDEFISNAYAGGRVECFEAGEFKDIKVYDVNSLYPSVMLTNEYPIGTPVKVSTFKSGKIGVYHIRFFQKDRTKPAVLWVKTKDSGLTFTYDGEGYFFNPEIEEALRQGVEIEILEGYVWLRSANLFKDFVEYYYKLRLKNKNNAIGYCCKIILNSLYGKFGQKENKSVLRRILDHDELMKLIKNKNYEVKVYKATAALYEITYNRPIDHRLIQLAAYTTSLARIRLYQALSDDVIYCDTDSVHIKDGNFRGRISDKIGDWKLENSGEGIYIGRKQYWLNGKAKFKGVKEFDILGKGEVLIKKDDYLKILNGESLGKKFLSFPKLKSVISGSPACRPYFITKTLERGRYLSSRK